MKFEIYKQDGRTLLGGGEWRWRLRAANNEIIASGESFKTKEDCRHSVDLVRSTNHLTPVEEVRSGLASLLINPQ